MITQAKLDHWLEHNLNVLFIGKHGVGKTARVIETFNKHKLKFLAFSAATMDPWVDFIGVPKEVTKNGVSYLELIRPKVIEDGEIEALFFDEYNRAPKKIRNATMELIQFKSINGRKFPNLRVIWAAINPENESGEITKYDVEALDPAQKDRFQVHCNFPYKPDHQYFTAKYGEKAANHVISWWDKQDDAIKDMVSPRRLDAVTDYVIKCDGDPRDILSSEKINCNEFAFFLKNGPLGDKLIRIFNDKDIAAAQKAMRNENSFDEAMSFLKKTENRQYFEFFIDYIPKEKLIAFITTESKIEYPENEINITHYFHYSLGHKKCLFDIYSELLKSNLIGDSEVQLKSLAYSFVNMFNAQNMPKEKILEITADWKGSAESFDKWRESITTAKIAKVDFDALTTDQSARTTLFSHLTKHLYQDPKNEHILFALGCLGNISTGSSLKELANYKDIVKIIAAFLTYLEDGKVTANVKKILQNLQNYDFEGQDETFAALINKLSEKHI